ncbi:MAG: hypothetical protein PUP92_39190 [Rhizonema sp. PD38]|nr:hypothetical protein [Rhizonema sp. PD38]
MITMKNLSIATIVGTAFMALGIASGVQRVEAASFSFTKVVDTNTNIPGGTENFGSFPSAPSLENGITAFVGDRGVYNATPFKQGVYTTNLDGELKVVADSNTPIPGDTGNFAFFNDPSLDNTRVAFRGFGVTVVPTGGYRYTQEGIYTNIGGSVNVVADRNTLIPGGTGNFAFFSVYPSINDGGVAFVGSGNNFTQGIYTNIDGELKVVADSNTQIPDGTGNFNDFDVSYGIPTLDNGSVAFVGSGNSFQRGIYTILDGSLSVIADRNTSVPDSKENFSSFDYPSLNNGSVAFVGSGNNFQRGVYTTLGGSLNVVADRNTPIPGGTGNFNNFGFVSLNDGNIAFTGSPIANFIPTAIYTTLGGSLTKVIGNNDSFEGKTIRFLTFGSEGLSGNQIAFRAVFTDSSEGIYIATINPTSIPESPMVLGVLEYSKE